MRRNETTIAISNKKYTFISMAAGKMIKTPILKIMLYTQQREITAVRKTRKKNYIEIFKNINLRLEK